MATTTRRWATALLLFIFLIVATAEQQQEQQHPILLKAVQQMKDSLVEQLGWNRDEVLVSSVDVANAQVGESLMYELDIDIGGKRHPIWLVNDVASWRYLLDAQEDGVRDHGSLAPFQLAGPLELWIQDSKQLRLAVLHDVDAGVVNRVMLADGAKVTIVGAREVSLARPLKLPLAAATDGTELLASLASELREASLQNGKPLLSLRIVGPTSMVSTSSSGSSAPDRLKVKRLAPGAVQLAIRDVVDSSSQGTSLLEHQQQQEQKEQAVTASWLWPLASVNSSNPMLELLGRQLGSKQASSFNLLKARTMLASFVKVEFQLERRADNKTLENWPEWATKPSTAQRVSFELSAKVDGTTGRLLPVSVKSLDAVIATPPPSLQELVLAAAAANATSPYSRSQPWLTPLSPLTLDP